MTQQIDPRQLVQWLGADGARAGLIQSKRVTIEALRALAELLDIKLPEKTTRQHWIDEIVKVASRRIDKPLHELFTMDEQALLDYFEHIDVQPAELLDILKELDVIPRREGRRSLMELAARELSETGRFLRIAGKQARNGDIPDTRTQSGKRDAQKRYRPDSQTEPGAVADRPRD